MIIHIHTIVKDEEVILPYFIRHYSTFADKIFIMYKKSSDKTEEILRESAKVNSRVIPIDLNYDDGNDPVKLADFNFSMVELSCKFRSRGIADYVMCVDADELMYNPNMLEQMQMNKDLGKRVIRSTGYQMVSPTLPTTNGQIYEEIFIGVRSSSFTKIQIFDPKLDVKFTHGRHKIFLPEGIYAEWGKISLLHFKMIGKEYFEKRARERWYLWGYHEPYTNKRIRKGLDLIDGIKEPLRRIVWTT